MRPDAVRIRLDGCGKTFTNGTRALQPLDLDIGAGETLALLGPSGCGKTTTLRIIAGLEQPDEGGRVWFDEENVTAVPIERRNVGMVFQSYALFPNMNVAENIGYGLKVRGALGSDERARQVARLLDMMHMRGYGDRRVDQLSGGQRQRVALARALAVQPRVLLLDEPLTALDAKLRENLRVDIDRLLRSLGITTVYVTHDQGEAMALGDRIAVMAEGRIAQIGTPQDIYYHPSTAFVADFIGTMNRLTGRAVDGELRTVGGALPLPTNSEASDHVMFRPHDARIVDAAQGDLVGRIISVFFLGGLTRVIVDLGDEQSVVIETSERRAFQKGDAIGIRVERNSVLTLRR